MVDQGTKDAVEWVILAHLLRPQGRKGELLAELLTDFPEQFATRQGIALRKAGGSVQPTTVEAHWLPLGKNVGRIVLKFQGIDSINDAELLSGFDVVVPPEERIELDEDAEYIEDLLDCTIVDGEHTIGVVEDVHFPTNATGGRLAEVAPMLIVRSPKGDEILIPFAKAWIQSVDVEGKRIEMRLPDGLLDING